MLLPVLFAASLSGAPVPPVPMAAEAPVAAQEEAESASIWAQQLSEAMTQAEARYVEGLQELADWCHDSRAYASRNQALTSLLHFRPDDAKARKTLRYRFDRRENAWQRRATFRSPSDGSAAATAEYAQRRDALDAVYVGHAMDAIEEAEKNLGPAETLTKLRSLYAVAPGQPRLLERLGYENVAPDGEPPVWVSAASVRTPARREQMVQWIDELRPEPEAIEDAELDEIDSSIDVEWKELRRFGQLRLAGRASSKESDAALGVAATSLGFLAKLVDEPPKLPEPWTVYLLERQEDMNRFIRSYPGMDDSQRSRARKLGSMWLPGKARCGVWGADPIERADMVCKQVAVRFLDVRYGVNTARGWLVEALGLYVNYAVVGTRLSRHVAITEYAKPGEVPVSLGLEDPDADWLQIAAGLLEDLKPKDFARALGRNTSEMTSEDVAVTYAFVAYLCEGAEPGALRAILEQVGSGSASSVVAIENHFQLPLFEVLLRLQAWLQAIA